MFGLGEIRVYVLDDLLRRLGKDCEVCVYGPAKRRFLTHQCCKCIERAERLVHCIVPDPNYISNPEKLDKWLISTFPEFECAESFQYTELSPCEKKAYREWKRTRQLEDQMALGIYRSI